MLSVAPIGSVVPGPRCCFVAFRLPRDLPHRITAAPAPGAYATPRNKPACTRTHGPLPDRGRDDELVSLSDPRFSCCEKRARPWTDFCRWPPLVDQSGHWRARWCESHRSHPEPLPARCLPVCAANRSDPLRWSTAGASPFCNGPAPCPPPDRSLFCHAAADVSVASRRESLPTVSL